MVKPTGYSTNFDYLTKNFKNEIISQHSTQRQQLLQAKENAFPTETEYFEPKISIREKPISVVQVDEVPTKAKGNSRGGGGPGGGSTSAFDAGKLDPIVLMNGGNGAGTGHKGGNAGEEVVVKQPPMSIVLRNVDHRKIQSDTKDIEDDSGNNFVSERKVIILPTSQPTQRSTLPNVYSNAGGSGLKLDDVELHHSEAAAARRRHRRGRKNR